MRSGDSGLVRLWRQNKNMLKLNNFSTTQIEMEKSEVNQELGNQA